MDSIEALLTALKASAAAGDRDAAAFLRMFGQWATCHERERLDCHEEVESPLLM